MKKSGNITFRQLHSIVHAPKWMCPKFSGIVLIMALLRLLRNLQDLKIIMFSVRLVDILAFHPFSAIDSPHSTALSSLGELSANNPNCWVRHDPTIADRTRNVCLQITMTESDKTLRSIMEQAIFQIILTLAHGQDSAVEYWSPLQQTWTRERLPTEEMWDHALVHEAGTAKIGPICSGGSLDDFCRPHGCQNAVSANSSKLSHT